MHFFYNRIAAGKFVKRVICVLQESLYNSSDQWDDPRDEFLHIWLFQVLIILANAFSHIYIEGIAHKVSSFTSRLSSSKYIRLKMFFYFPMQILSSASTYPCVIFITKAV